MVGSGGAARRSPRRIGSGAIADVDRELHTGRRRDGGQVRRLGDKDNRPDRAAA